MSRSSLDIPPVPADLVEYRSKIWTEVHLLRSDFQTVEMLEAIVWLAQVFNGLMLLLIGVCASCIR
jgi:hypothetical protein